jgi:hypothetical protein
MDDERSSLMSSQKDEIMKLQQVGAYSTKHKADNKEVPLLSNDPPNESGKQLEASPDRAQ